MKRENTSNKSRRFAVLTTIAVPLLAAVAILLRKQILAFCESDWYPGCAFHEMTGYLCPGCGNTHAVLELFYGHFFRSFGYNPMIPLLALAFLAWYLEQVCAAFGRQVRILPRSRPLFYGILGLVLGYDILRNVFSSWTLLAVG